MQVTSRRSFLKRSASVAAVTGATGGAVAATTIAAADADPVVDLFRRWKAVQRSYEAAVEKRLAVQEAVEARFGAICPRVRLGDVVGTQSRERRPIYASCDEEIEAYFSAKETIAPEQRAAKIETAKAGLRAERERWLSLREEAGLPALETVEDDHGWQEFHLSEDIVAARCTTPEGAAAKLRLAMHYIGGGEDDEDYPWPILMSLLRDLRVMRASG